MNKEQLKLIIISLALLLAVDYSYVHIIVIKFNGSPAIFGNFGYPIGKISYIRLIYALIIIYLLSFVVPLKINSPSSLVLSVYYYVAIVPYLSMFTMNLSANSNIYYIDIFNIFIFYLITKFFLNKKYNVVSIIKKEKIDFVSIFIIISSIFLLVFMYITYGKNSSITFENLLDVYGQRESFNESAGLLGSLISGYIIYGAIPFLIFMYKKNNNYLYVIVALFIGFLTFLTTGSKLFLGSTFLTVFLMIKFRNNFSHSYIGIFLFLLTLFSITLATSYNSFLLISLFVRRMLVIPAQLFGLFHEYVNNFGYNYLAAYTSFLTGHNPVSISHEIGNEYYRIGSSANNGIISDAYANFGLIGVLIYSFLFVFIFKFSDKQNARYNNLLTPLFVGLAISLTNSSLLAVFVYQISMLLIVFQFYNITKRIKK